MTDRYCPKCKAVITFVDSDTKCPVCCKETIPDDEKARIERVRAKFIKAIS